MVHISHLLLHNFLNFFLEIIFDFLFCHAFGFYKTHGIISKIQNYDKALKSDISIESRDIDTK